VRDRALKADAVDLAAEITDWTPPRLPVGGREVMRLGVPPGPETGAVLAAFERGWIADDFDLDDVEGRLAAAVRAVRGSAP
jgi:poly(A) polymerase